MEFRILGPLDVREDGRALELGGAKQRALLTALLLSANRVVSSDRLIECLWDEQPPGKAQKALHVHVSILRKGLGRDRIVTRAPGYLIRVEPGELDLERFRSLIEQGGAERLGEALDLWRGPPLAEFAYERFAEGEIAQIEELRLVALELRIDADLRLGRHAVLVGELEAIVGEHPLRERMRALLMVALYRSGRQAEALEAYHEARRVLVEELGIEPGRSLRELEKAILQQDPSLDLASPSEPAGETTEESTGAFVGREAELDELLAGLEDAVAGRGRLFLLAGEPGIGKSRLADELIRRARAREATVLIGRCWEAGGAPAYWPWVQSLRGYIREAEPEALRAQLGAGAVELAQVLPELHELLPGLLEPASLDSEGARFRLFDATTEFLRNASERNPMVVFLDDLHAADTPSLLLLQFFAREIGSSHLLFLGAFRDVDPIPGQPLTTLLSEVIREPVTRRLSLAGLSELDIAEYVERTASEIASPELAMALHEGTEGNPLFVGETVRLLSVEGLRPEPAGARIAIPQSIKDVISRRLAHLPDECNRVLLLASVLGREFALDALARMGDVSEEALLDTLDEAMIARVISGVPGGPGHLRFAHVLIRDTLYEGLTTTRRVRLHRQAVGALEALYGDEPGTHLAELAYHAVAASVFDKGLRYAQPAGDRALALLAFEEAVELYETSLEALDLSDPSNESKRCDLLLSLGEAQARAGNTQAAKKAFLAAAAVARRLGLTRELAHAAAGYGGRIVWVRAGGDEQLVPLLEEGLAALEEEEVELRARLLARLAGALRDEHSRERRDALSREAVELARRAGNAGALAYALAGRGHAIIAPDTVAECLTLGTELCEVAAGSVDRERIQVGHQLRIVAELMLGDVRGAEADLAAASRIADDLRQPAQLWDARVAQALLALAAGRLGEADELVEQAFALGERAVPDGAIPIYRLQRYTLCDFRGDLEKVEQPIRDLVGEYPARPVFRCALAHLHARLGRLPEARRALGDLAVDDFSALPFDQEWLYGMSLLAETSALAGDIGSASVLYELLAPWGAFNAVDIAEGFRGSVSRYLGLLAATTQRWDDAELHFEDALALNAKMGALPWLARTQEDYARMLVGRGGPGDADRSEQLLDAALTTYRELGMEATL